MNTREHIVAIIPARYGATRLPGKPLIDLAGKSMVQRVYERARRAKTIHKVVVATDDRRIVEAVEAFGGEASMTPSKLQSGSDRIAHLAKDFPEATIIVNVQGDEPLIEPQMIDQAVQLLVDNPKLEVGTLVKKIASKLEIENPNIVKVVLDEQGFALYFSRSPIPHRRDGEGNPTFYKHIGLYVYRKDFLQKFSKWPESELEQTEKLEQLRILVHGVRIKTGVTEFDSIPIDTPADADRVRKIFSSKEPANIGARK